MQISTGVVVGGKVVVEGAPLVEGSVVTVISRAADEAFTLSLGDEQEILASISEIERGEFISDTDLLESLRKHG